MAQSLFAAGQALNGDAWGLHDAEWLGVRIDWRARVLELDLSLAVSERGQLHRRARFVVTGLVFFVLEPPHPRSEGARYWEVAGDQIDVHETPCDSVTGERPGLPPLPPGAWCCTLYDSGLNTLANIAGEDCTGTWVGEPVSRASNVFFPGDTAPIPGSGSSD